MLKILQWIVLNFASVCGILQALIKCIKEIVTAVANLLAALVILIPGVSFAQANKITMAVRAWIEWLDTQVQKLTTILVQFSTSK